MSPLPRGHSSAHAGADDALIDPRRVAAVVPAYNETGKIGDVVRKVPRGYAAAGIVGGDCSRDATPEGARAAGAEPLGPPPAQPGGGGGGPPRPRTAQPDGV